MDVDRSDVTTSEGIIALAISHCTVECISLASSASHEVLAPLSASGIIMYPHSLAVTTLQSYSMETFDRDPMCETACSRDPKRAFGMDPSCALSCCQLCVPGFRASDLRGSSLFRAWPIFPSLYRLAKGTASILSGIETLA